MKNQKEIAINLVKKDNIDRYICSDNTTKTHDELCQTDIIVAKVFTKYKDKECTVGVKECKTPYSVCPFIINEGKKYAIFYIPSEGKYCFGSPNNTVKFKSVKEAEKKLKKLNQKMPEYTDYYLGI